VSSSHVPEFKIARFEDGTYAIFKIAAGNPGDVALVGTFPVKDYAHDYAGILKARAAEAHERNESQAPEQPAVSGPLALPMPVPASSTVEAAIPAQIGGKDDDLPVYVRVSALVAKYTLTRHQASVLDFMLCNSGADGFLKVFATEIARGAGIGVYSAVYAAINALVSKNLVCVSKPGSAHKPTMYQVLVKPQKNSLFKAAPSSSLNGRAAHA
jgi:hypothetical protein